MIEFESIEIENFCAAGHIKLQLNQPGLILVQGVNKDAPKADSNGSGKSLIFDAICWCIWGTTVRGLSSDRVIRDIFKDGVRARGKDCRVSLTLREGTDTYIITRYRGDTRIDKPNDLRVFINGVEKGRKMKNLQEIVDRLVGFDFQTFCAMMPGTGVKAANMTDSEIKKLLEKILQTENLSAAYDKARARSKELDTQLAAESAKQKRIQDDLASLEREVAQLRELEKSFDEAKRTRIAAHKDRMQVLVVEVEQASKALEELKKLRDTEASIIAEAAEIQEQLREHTLLKRKLADDRALCQAELTSTEQNMRRLQSLGDVCNVCLQPVSAEHVQPHLATYHAKVAQTKALLVENTEAAHEAAKLSALADQALAQRKAALTMLQKQLATEAVHKAAKARAAQDFKREQQALKDAEAQTANFSQMFTDKAAKAFDLAAELSLVLKALKALQTEKKLCSFWVDGFSPSGLRSHMLDYVTPILNDRAAYYSDVLTSGVMKVTFTTKRELKNGDTKDEFQILVDQLYGSESYEGVSTGEKARADLIISMALGDLAAYRTAKQLPWRFIDEAFENIDKAGNEAIVNLLNDQKSRYKTVFVITHKPSLQSMFTQRVTVTKKDGVSTAECNWNEER